MNAMAQVKPTSPIPSKRTPRTIAGVVPAPKDPGRAHILSMYEDALRLMQKGQFDKAHQAFDKMLLASPGDLADRIRMYINACLLQVSKGATSFTSHEERYDYAISLLNLGQYDDASEHFKAILAENDKADYAFYGLAARIPATASRHAPTPTSRTWPTIPASPNSSTPRSNRPRRPSPPRPRRLAALCWKQAREHRSRRP
jgi:tetratricopeptide (TPR) repeat protein